MNKNKTLPLFSLLLLASLALNACSMPKETTPTPDIALIQTQAVETFTAGITATALAMPSATPTETPSPTPSETPTLTPTSTMAATLVILPTTTCNSLAFIKDVTIPDNTKMAPGQAFTKTWRVKNNGTCDWEKGFQVKFFSGSAMGGKSLTLDKTVSPGGELEISIAMTAPANSGVYTGNWRMTDENGAYFGDSFYVMILVGDSTATPTTKPATPTATLEPAPSDTPDS